MNEQKSLFKAELEEKDSGPVECLGMTFENEEKRREYFLEKLREKLKDPEFRKIEGFPIGEDEDILALSDPPYYTACPNPFLGDFIKQYGKPYDPANDSYKREPFAADVSEGKNDPIYNAHSYHTKVPHKAIMRYILHYTEPGDIVFDGFCGTGMTGVAAQLCKDRNIIESLGYRIDKQDNILRMETGENGETIWLPFSKVNARYAILNDLSPAATFIAHNFNTQIDTTGIIFETTAEGILDKLEAQFGSRFKVRESKEDSENILEYSVWSDVYSCPNCTAELCYWDIAVDTDNWKLKSEIFCPHCGIDLGRKDLSRAWVTFFDPVSGKTIRRAKKIRVWDVWKDGGYRKERPVAQCDRISMENWNEFEFSSFTPIKKIPEGDKTSDPYSSGINFVHQYWTPRTLVVLSKFWEMAQATKCPHILLFLMTSALDRVSLRNGYRPQHKMNKSRELGGPLPGNLYIPIFSVELNPIIHIRSRIKSVKRMLDETKYRNRKSITTQSTSSIVIPPNSVDYIFVDPPFGSNIMYSELSFAMESWLKIVTNNTSEAIVNSSQQKSEASYTMLMYQCFREMHRILKPGRWITVEFHNSRNAIWTAIQEALTRAGFIVADVRTLSRNLGSLNQLTSANAVKQDLIISAYKPNGGLEGRFKLEAGTEDGAWDFVRTHLKQLPVFVSKDGKAEIIVERENFLLYDRMVAYHVQRGVSVPLSAADFYQGLTQRFAERDGMYFLPEQTAEYDKKRMTVTDILQLQLFIMDEASAIQWLKQQLIKKPQTFQDIHPQFIKEIGGWQKHEKTLELSLILEQNFLRCDGKGDVPNQVHNYLSINYKELQNLPKDDPTLRAKAKDRWYVPDPNSASDLEKLREKALLKEFTEYLPPGYEPPKIDKTQPSLPGMKPEINIPYSKKLKVFRLEAVRAGFKKAWQEGDYVTIIAVARRIPENVLQEDPKLLMWYDQARTRLEIT